MNLCLSTGGKSESNAQQLGLLPAYLILRLKYGIDKLLVRNLASEISLGHIIVYLELGVLKKFLSAPYPHMGRRISVIGVYLPIIGVCRERISDNIFVLRLIF